MPPPEWRQQHYVLRLGHLKKPPAIYSSIFALLCSSAYWYSSRTWGLLDFECPRQGFAEKLTFAEAVEGECDFLSIDEADRQ